eukprot:5252063-Prymnesium_polylepis.1
MSAMPCLSGVATAPAAQHSTIERTTSAYAARRDRPAAFAARSRAQQMRRSVSGTAGACSFREAAHAAHAASICRRNAGAGASTECVLSRRAPKRDARLKTHAQVAPAVWGAERVRGTVSAAALRFRRQRSRSEGRAPCACARATFQDRCGGASERTPSPQCVCACA